MILTTDHMLAEMGVVLVTISSKLVAAKWLNDIMVSGAIASKKKGFIHGSPLIRRKKGLGEGKHIRADMLSAASHRHHLAQIVVNCDGKYSCVFCKSDLVYG